MPKASLLTLAQQFLKYLEIKKNYSPLTIRNYKHYLDRFLTFVSPTPQKFSPEKISLEKVKKYQNYLSKFVDKDKKPLSQKTQAYHLTALRSFLRFLAQKNYQVFSPEEISLPRQKKNPLKFLNRNQVERLLVQPNLSKPQGLRDKAILEMLFSSGLQVSEVVALNKDSVDLKTKKLHVFSKNGSRIIFLSERAVFWLARYLVTREDSWKPLFVRTVKKIKAYNKGEEMRLSPRTIQRIVKKYAKKAKLPNRITPQSLRCTYAVNLLQTGVDLKIAQKLLGHKNVATTKVYKKI